MVTNLFPLPIAWGLNPMLWGGVNSHLKLVQHLLLVILTVG
jgi:hypothetical protein